MISAESSESTHADVVAVRVKITRTLQVPPCNSASVGSCVTLNTSLTIVRLLVSACDGVFAVDPT